MTKNKNVLITPADITSEVWERREAEKKDTISGTPAISDHLAKQLSIISPCTKGKDNCYPCDVQLASGRYIEDVILYEIENFIAQGGSWRLGHNIPGNIKITDIKNIYPSKNRISEAISEKIGAFEETGMGYSAFFFIFKNSVRKLAICGGQCFFFKFDDLFKPEDIVDVEPFDRKTDTMQGSKIGASQYHFGFYSLTARKGIVKGT